MIAVMQTDFGRGPKFGESCGNCLQASLASILELPLDAVPHFCDLRAYEEPEGESRWQERMNEWLEKHFGLRVLYITDTTGRKPDGYHLRDGISHRGSMHVTVALRGETVHDPHPEGGVLSGDIQFGIFVAVDPARHFTTRNFIRASERG